MWGWANTAVLSLVLLRSVSSSFPNPSPSSPQQPSPPSPLLPSPYTHFSAPPRLLVNWSDFPPLHAIDLVLHALLAPQAQTDGWNRLMLLLTNGTGCLSLNTASLNLTVNLTEDLTLVVDGVALCGFDNVTAVSLLTPVGATSLSTHVRRETATLYAHMSLKMASVGAAGTWYSHVTTNDNNYDNDSRDGHVNRANRKYQPNSYQIKASGTLHELSSRVVALVEAWEDPLLNLRLNQIKSGRCWNQTLQNASFTTVKVSALEVVNITIDDVHPPIAPAVLDLLCAALRPIFNKLVVQGLAQVGPELQQSGNQWMAYALGNTSLPACPAPNDHEAVLEPGAWPIVPILFALTAAAVAFAAVHRAFQQDKQMAPDVVDIFLQESEEHSVSTLHELLPTAWGWGSSVVITVLILVAMSMRAFSLLTWAEGLTLSLVVNEEGQPQVDIFKRTLINFSFPLIVRYLYHSRSWFLAATVVLGSCVLQVIVLSLLLLAFWVPLTARRRKTFLHFCLYNLRHSFADVTFAGFNMCLFAQTTTFPLSTMPNTTTTTGSVPVSSFLLTDPATGTVSVFGVPVPSTLLSSSSSSTRAVLILNVTADPERAVYFSLAAAILGCVLAHVLIYTHDTNTPPSWERAEEEEEGEEEGIGKRATQVTRGQRALAVVAGLVSFGLLLATYSGPLISFYTGGLVGAIASGNPNGEYQHDFWSFTIPMELPTLTAQRTGAVFISTMYITFVLVAPLLLSLSLLLLWCMAPTASLSSPLPQQTHPKLIPQQQHPTLSPASSSLSSLRDATLSRAGLHSLAAKCVSISLSLCSLEIFWLMAFFASFEGNSVARYSFQQFGCDQFRLATGLECIRLSSQLHPQLWLLLVVCVLNTALAFLSLHVFRDQVRLDYKPLTYDDYDNHIHVLPPGTSEHSSPYTHSDLSSDMYYEHSIPTDISDDPYDSRGHTPSSRSPYSLLSNSRVTGTRRSHSLLPDASAQSASALSAHSIKHRESARQSLPSFGVRDDYMYLGRSMQHSLQEDLDEPLGMHSD